MRIFTKKSIKISEPPYDPDNWGLSHQTPAFPPTLLQLCRVSLSRNWVIPSQVANASIVGQ